MQYTALSTHPTLQGKSREIRLLFADTTNQAIEQGRSESEAVFKGLAVVKQAEQKSIKKFVPQTIPSHLRAILDVRSTSNLALEAQEQLEKEKATADTASSSKDVVGASFTTDGRLILKFRDGTSIKTNQAPVTAVETNVVVVNGDGTSTTPIDEDENIDGGSASAVFKPIEIIDGGDVNG